MLTPDCFELSKAHRLYQLRCWNSQGGGLPCPPGTPSQGEIKTLLAIEHGKGWLESLAGRTCPARRSGSESQLQKQSGHTLTKQLCCAGELPLLLSASTLQRLQAGMVESSKQPGWCPTPSQGEIRVLSIEYGQVGVAGGPGWEVPHSKEESIGVLLRETVWPHSGKAAVLCWGGSFLIWTVWSLQSPQAGMPELTKQQRWQSTPSPGDSVPSQTGSTLLLVAGWNSRTVSLIL